MEENKIMLSDIAGYKEEKEEITKLIKLLTDYKKYEKTGVYVPKGLILQGPPGCGKTLFAKAIANECNVPFLTFQAESDAKVSLEKLAKLFAQAKEHTPSIIYIDEIDKLTSSRYLGSDSVRTVIQYLLTELDGLTSSQGIMVIASTNYYGDLPESLVRSGRMDKKICIDYPNLESRIAILEHYIKKHRVFDNVNIKSLAIKIKGMSGADIKTLVNNALIEYIDTDKVLTVDDFVGLINQMNFDDIGRRWNSKNVVTKVLIHEAGHSIVNYFLTGTCGAISGIKYGESAGHTDLYEEFEFDEDDLFGIIEESEQESSNVSKKDLLNQIAALFAGIMAEKTFYGTYDSGGYSDIHTATRIYNDMANLFFLDSKYIGIDTERLNDPKVVHSYLKARDRVFKKQMKTCCRIINKYKYLIRYIVDEAMAHEDTLNSAQIRNCIEYYYSHKKELATKYKNSKLVDEKKPVNDEFDD